MTTSPYRLSPRTLLRWLLRRSPPPVGLVRFGSLRRVSPISANFGFDRGQPVDRHYIESFLARCSADVQGRVVEVGDDAYSRRFGGGRVTRQDILHVSADNPRATIVADLASADHIPASSFDCVVVTQTLHLIYDIAAAVRTVHRILRPGGVCLATVPGISQVDKGAWQDYWYWSLTPTAARRLFTDAFTGGEVAVEAHGNVLASTAFLYGLAASELSPAELDARDPSYPLVVAIRAVKARGA